MKIEDTIKREEENLKDRKEQVIPEDLVEKEIPIDADEAPYEDDYMPDSPRHGVISSRPDLFDEDELRLEGDGTVSEDTDQYDEANFKEDEILD